ncbi:MAG: DUF4215 domain-containing protein [Deltaproteobacteria bacterium]|nr:DUF4215 domain-containing protein [Deltaproteobacteria bacterium]
MYIYKFQLVVAVGLLLCMSGCAVNEGDADGDDTVMGDTSLIVQQGSDKDSSATSDYLDTGLDTGDTDSGTEIDTSGCGNGVIESTEVCDDGNSVSRDGCSALCDAVESGYVCGMPGEKCTYTIVCGDGQVSGNETCDDFDTDNSDGCSSTCQLEAGWICPLAGENCVAAACGDSMIAGNEECDDGNTVDSDGCSKTCRLEDGWACGTPGTTCFEAVCNNGKKEGKEPCDDGNLVVGDGCTPFCKAEPQCSRGICTSACGDGIVLPGSKEECDDGNRQDNDGCSAACKIETGFYCQQIVDPPPAVLEVPVIYRDFIALPAEGARRHPDFELFSGDGITPGLVEHTLGIDGKPVYTGICESTAVADTDDPNSVTNPTLCPYGAQTTSKPAFKQWHNDIDGINITSVGQLPLTRQADGTYVFEDGDFFPVENAGWVADGSEEARDGHNYGFTSELRYWFEYKGGESLQFLGDDDVWVFINNHLAVDIGGLHESQSAGITLDDTMGEALGLTKGKIYEVVLFHAERHTYASRYKLTLSGFTTIESTCESICGDGILASNETCDDGVNNGSYGSCNKDCTRGPRCGDGTVQNPQEACDDGVNLTVYSTTGLPGCAPGCVLGAWCGDGEINGLFGEECDDGINVGGYGKCGSDCTLGPRCGDAIVQPEYEECDDANSVSGDGCGSDCLKEIIYLEK